MADFPVGVRVAPQVEHKLVAGTSITLEFKRERDDEAGSGKGSAQSVSAIVAVGDSIFAGGDEGVTLVRLESRDQGTRFVEKDAIDLRNWFDIPEPTPEKPGAKVSEIDLEGFAIEGDADDRVLWLLGSHSFKRGKPKQDESSEKNLKKLTKVSLDPNRLLLGCIPLKRMADDQWRIAEAGPEAGESRAAQLEPDVGLNPLLVALRSDKLLSRYLTVDSELAGKDNGLDFEGLVSVSKNRLLIGLRGPVLRGVAMILEVAVHRVASDGTADRLELLPIGPDGRFYRRHFVDLAGNGVRDLCWDGNDLLILAGPTMSLDSPPLIYRWTGAALLVEKGAGHPERFHWHATNGAGVNGDVELVRPNSSSPTWEQVSPGQDHAESISFLDKHRRQLLIAYDAPGPLRLKDAVVLALDLVEWAG